MKKWLLLLCALSVLLTGCGREQTTQVGICLRQCDDSAAAEQLDTIHTALTQAGFTVAAADAEADQARQLRQVEELIHAGYDLLIVEPVMQEQASAIAKLGMDADVPVIFIGYAPEQTLLDSWDKLCYVGSVQEQAGALQGQLPTYLPEGGDLNGDGILTYAVIAGPADHMDAIALTQACTEAVEKGECLEVSHTDWSEESAKTACAKLLATYGKDMEVVLCNSDTLAMGAMEAIAEGGRVVGQTIYLAGMGGDIQSRLLIRSGDLSGTVYLPAKSQAELITATATALLAGKSVEKVQYGAFVILTQDTVESYIED